MFNDLKINSYVLFSKKNVDLQSPGLKKNLLIYQTKLKSYLAPWLGNLAIDYSLR